MADYKETDIAGKSWQRASRVIIENTYQQTPVMRVCEQEMLQVGDRVIPSDLGVTLELSFDTDAQFPLRHPITDELIGETARHADLQMLLYSLVRHLQEERDKVV